MIKKLLLAAILLAGCQNPRTEMQLGNRAYLSGRPQEALAYYQAALQAPETRAAASYNLGRLYLGQGQPVEALERFELAQGPDLNLLRAQAYRRQGMFEQARAALGDTDSPRVSLERARIDLAASTNTGPGILALLEKARKDPVLSEAATLEIVRLRESQGQFGEALAELERLAQTHPQRLDIDHRVGANLLLLNRFPEAESRFRRSVQRDPSFLPAYLGLGRALEGQGRIEEAGQLYQSLASQLPPDDQAAQEARRRLEALKGG